MNVFKKKKIKQNIFLLLLFKKKYTKTKLNKNNTKQPQIWFCVNVTHEMIGADKRVTIVDLLPCLNAVISFQRSIASKPFGFKLNIVFLFLLAKSALLYLDEKLVPQQLWEIKRGF